METATKRQVSEVIYGKTAQQTAEQRRNELVRSDDTVHEIAAPWDKWSVEPVNGGWAVFVEEV